MRYLFRLFFEEARFTHELISCVDNDSSQAKLAVSWLPHADARTQNFRSVSEQDRLKSITQFEIFGKQDSEW